MPNDNRDKGNQPTEIYRIRRSEVVGILTLPVAVALLGLLWNYTHTNQVDTERKITNLRSEIHGDIRDTKLDLRRELDRCCK